MGFLILLIAVIVGVVTYNQTEPNTLSESNVATAEHRVQEGSMDIYNLHQEPVAPPVVVEQYDFYAPENDKAPPTPVFSDGTELHDTPPVTKSHGSENELVMPTPIVVAPDVRYGLSPNDEQIAVAAGKLPPRVVDESGDCSAVANYSRTIETLKQMGVSRGELDKFAVTPTLTTFPIKAVQKDVYSRKFDNPGQAYSTYYSLCTSTGYENLLNILRNK